MGGVTAPLSSSPMDSNGVTKADTTAHDDVVRAKLIFRVLFWFGVIEESIALGLLCLTYLGIDMKASAMAVITLIAQAPITALGFGLGYYYGMSSGGTSRQVAAEKAAAK